eukprot:752283-Alexandrium_andersonii.AAC.1
MPWPVANRPWPTLDRLRWPRWSEWLNIALMPKRRTCTSYKGSSLELRPRPRSLTPVWVSRPDRMSLLCKRFLRTQGQSEQAQNRAQVLERRLEVAAGLLTDNEELREQAKAKDA